MTPQIRSYADIKTDLEKSIAWIEQGLGKSFHANSRVRKYVADITEIEAQWELDGATAAIRAKTLPVLLNSMREGNIIGQVVTSLIAAAAADDELTKKMFDSLQGPAHAKDETVSSNKARNLFFELRILSRCLSAGLPAESCLHPDVRTTVDGIPVHVECKRVFAASNIANLVSSARNQLLKQIERDPAVVGVVALDLTRLVAFRSAYIEIASSEAWDDVNRSINAKIQKDYDDDVRKAFLRNARTGIQGVIYSYDMAVFNRSSNSLGTGYSLEFVPLDGGSLAPASVLRKLHQAMVM